MIHQGHSKITARKEFEIEGLSWMRLTQFKNQHFAKEFNKIIVADIFSGSGHNEIEGRIVEGSPIKILNAITRVQNPKGKLTKRLEVPIDFWFSDIRKIACMHLKKLIYIDHGHINPEIHAVSAADALNILGGILHQEPHAYLYLVIDPNGPKDFPLLELNDLCRTYSRRIDVIANLSVTALNRCIGARNKAGMDFKCYLKEIPNFKAGFIEGMTQNGRQGWIRTPVQGDCQKWAMIPTFGCMAPKNDWSKQGYVAIRSKEGRAAINYYCGEV